MENMHYQLLCERCGGEREAVGWAERLNTPAVRGVCEVCGKKRQVWKYKVFKEVKPRKTGEMKSAAPGGDDSEGRQR